MRACNTCGVEKPLEAFPKHADCKDGRAPQCKECRKVYLRGYRKHTRNAITRRYEKTPRGFVMRTYRNMLSRVSGIQHKKAHLYQGKPILERAAFYEWSLSDPSFNRLFEEWRLSGFARALTPSIDRIDSAGGYEPQNVRWITHSENSRGGSALRRQACA